jgi:hypothetical protein
MDETYFTNDQIGTQAIVAEVSAFCAENNVSTDSELFLLKCALCAKKYTHRPLGSKTTQQVYAIDLIALGPKIGLGREIPIELSCVCRVVFDAIVIDLGSVAPKYLAAKREFATLRSREAIAERKSVKVAKKAFMEAQSAQSSAQSQENTNV